MRAVLLAMLVAFSLPFVAASAGDGCVPSRGHTTASAEGVYLWVQPGHDLDPFHTSWGIWTESNGLEGLQRWDAVFDETCMGAVEPDTEVIAFYAL